MKISDISRRAFVAGNGTPPGLDIAASRSGGKAYLHARICGYSGSVEASFAVAGMKVASGRTWAIAPENLRQYVSLDQTDVFMPVEAAIPDQTVLKWRFPAGSVTAVELTYV